MRKIKEYYKNKQKAHLTVAHLAMNLHISQGLENVKSPPPADTATLAQAEWPPTITLGHIAEESEWKALIKKKKKRNQPKLIILL